MQNSRFRNAKSKIFTKQEGKFGIGKKQKADNIALCFHFATYIF